MTNQKQKSLTITIEDITGKIIDNIVPIDNPTEKVSLIGKSITAREAMLALTAVIEMNKSYQDKSKALDQEEIDRIVLDFLAVVEQII